MSPAEPRWTWNRYARPVPISPGKLQDEELHRREQDRNPERTPLDPQAEGPLEHLSRYLWAADRVPGRFVVDGGCGYGYGTRLLRQLGASPCLGLDLDAAALRVARGLALAASLEAMPLPSGSVELWVAFEVIEHLRDPRSFLREARRTLRAEGVLLLSTPNRDLVSPGWSVPPNRFHTREYNPAELRALLEEVFPRVELFGQIPGPRLRARRTEGRRARWLAVALERRIGLDVRRWLRPEVRRRVRAILGDRSVLAPNPKGSRSAESEHSPVLSPAELEQRIGAWLEQGLSATEPGLNGWYLFGRPEEGETLLAVCHREERPAAGSQRMSAA